MKLSVFRMLPLLPLCCAPLGAYADYGPDGCVTVNNIVEKYATTGGQYDYSTSGDLGIVTASASGVPNDTSIGRVRIQFRQQWYIRFPSQQLSAIPKLNYGVSSGLRYSVATTGMEAESGRLFRTSANGGANGSGTLVFPVYNSEYTLQYFTAWASAQVSINNPSSASASGSGYLQPVY